MRDFDQDGLQYHVEEIGHGKPLVLLHGFTGSARTWQHLIPALAQRRRVITIDLPGHGLTGVPDDAARCTFARVIDDLAGITLDLGIESAIWAGYSMGGRVALALAIEHPSRVAGLILESASPGIADPAARAERRQRDAELAESIERNGVPHFVREWERLPLWASQVSLPEEALSLQRAIRLGNSPRGLAGSLRCLGTGSQPSYWDRLPELERPVLLLAGQHDAKFTRIATEMQAALPNAYLEIISHAGHAIHLERPQHYLKLITQFMDDPRENAPHVLEEETA